MNKGTGVFCMPGYLTNASLKKHICLQYGLYDYSHCYLPTAVSGANGYEI